MKPLLNRRPGLRVPGVWDGFELALRAILGQQLTAADSPALAGRLVRAFGKPFPTSVPALTHLFPKPEDLIHADLARVNIRGSRASTIRALARSVCANELTFTASMTLEETISRIRTVSRVGEGTAHYIAMRVFGEPDAFPFADPALTGSLGVRVSADSPSEIRRIAEAWRPWRAYAAMHLAVEEAAPRSRAGRQ